MVGLPGEISQMPQLFTVRWPLLARLEAVLFVPVAVRLAGETELVQTFVNRRMLPSLSPFAIPLGAPAHVIFWASVTIAVIVPYVILLIVADRLLTVRKGLALLSVIAIAVWAGAASRWYFLLTDFVPKHTLGGTNWLSFDQEAALAAFGIALLLHLPALWVGLRDRGEVAERLLARKVHPYRRGNPMEQPQDVYFRQTADFRGWQQQKQLEGLAGIPKENSAVKMLSVIAWIGVVVGVSAAYLTWNGIASFGPRPGNHAPGPDVEAGPPRPGPGVKAAVPVVTPAAPGSPGMPPANVHAAATVPLPAVQRPTELSASVRSGGAISGPNEAVAERESDGSFAFDAVVNGTHVRMLFDTGASVVGLRAEDAMRLGIPVSRLNYSGKIKTANGTAEVASVTLETMIIGNITLRNVAGFVAKQGMLSENLLGQTFLARLSGFNVENNLLVLKGR
jgi:clan AA aspartic protease (TIGR02281 family)